MNGALKSAQVCSRGCTWNIGEKKAKVEELSTGGMDVEHSANSKAPGPVSPDALVLQVPNHLSRIVLIKKLANEVIWWECCIFLVPCSECGIQTAMFKKGLAKLCIIRVKDDTLLIRKVDLKAHYIGVLLLHVKKVKPPHSLTAANEPRIQVLANLICSSAKLHCCPVMALVDILVDVLDSLDRGNRLYVDMAPVLPEEIGRMAHHPLVVH
jgi:hypothetical protein